MVHARLRRERPGHTLNTTGLVHEAYIRPADVSRIKSKDRSHLSAWFRRPCGGYSSIMRENRNTEERGEVPDRQELDDNPMSNDDAMNLIELDDFLRKLGQHYPRHAEALAVRYFGGLTLEETAGVLAFRA